MQELKNKESPPEQRRFGAHVSIAGGLHLAFERAIESGCDCIQVFVKNQRQWRAKPLSESDIRAWEQARASAGVTPIVAHGTYLINLAAPNEKMWEQSINAFVDELTRCEQLGIIGLVIHPGSHIDQGEAWGIERIAQALDQIHARTPGFKVKTLLEVTAGQGSALGYRFEHLGEIMSKTRDNDRVAVCLDTCHLFAAGYDIDTAEGYAQTITELDKHTGITKIMCIHCNDSKKPKGSRVDRHDHIGKGLMGLTSFASFINDKRFFGVPMILETPKGEDEEGHDLDRTNLAALRSLIKT
jgi:deoxyribonuclease-4